MAPVMLLRVLSRLYGWAVARRRAKLRQLPAWRLPVPVISVGNITTGGTGKTEAVAYVCRRLMEHNIKPAVLSRGYRRRSRDTALVVSAGEGPVVPVSQSGDEPYLLAQRLKGTAVVVGADRWITGMLAIKSLGAQVLVLDDGFQRRDRLYRDLDLVLVDAADPFGGNALLPAGRLREPVEALAEADVLILTRSDQHETGALAERLSGLAPKALVCKARHIPAALVSLDGQKKQSPEYLAARRVLAVSGIARPQAFEQTLKSLGATVAGHFAFPDHHWFSDRDRRKIALRAQELNAEVVTTAKDAVRLGWPENSRILGWSMGVAFDFLEGGAFEVNVHLDGVAAAAHKMKH